MKRTFTGKTMKRNSSLMNMCSSLHSQTYSGTGPCRWSRCPMDSLKRVLRQGCSQQLLAHACLVRKQMESCAVHHPNLALARATSPLMVRCSFSLYSWTLCSRSACLALNISSLLNSRSFFLRSISLFCLLYPSIPSSSLPSRSESGTSSTPPPSVFPAANARFESAFSRFFSSLRSLEPASARGAMSSSCSFCCLRSSRRRLRRFSRLSRRSSWESSDSGYLA